jgi:uncharacterized protein YlxP (DUF503 family)
MALWLGLVTCELVVPGARSLKEKRRAVRSLVDRMYRRHRVSVAETGYQDLHQRAEISIAVVAGSEGEVDRLLVSLRGMTDDLHDAAVARWEEQVLDGQQMMFEMPGER